MTAPRRGLVAATSSRRHDQPAGALVGQRRDQRDRPLRTAPEHRRRSLDDGLDDADQPDRRPLAGPASTPTASGCARSTRPASPGVGDRSDLPPVAIQRVQRGHRLQRPVDDRVEPGVLGRRGRRSGTAGARATMTFTGRSIAWIARTGPNRGVATVYVNGSKVDTIDLYSPAYGTSGSYGYATGRARRRAPSPSGWPARPAARWSMSTPWSRRTSGATRFAGSPRLSRSGGTGPNPVPVRVAAAEPAAQVEGDADAEPSGSRAL